VSESRAWRVRWDRLTELASTSQNKDVEKPILDDILGLYASMALKYASCWLAANMSSAWYTTPPLTCLDSLYVDAVTTPKLAPAPRRPQNRSGFDVADTLIRSPVAVTRSAETSASATRPNVPCRYPIPAPRAVPVYPAQLQAPEPI
jgi:hypothetical protein